jgi:CheY-like chemotaxis protein
VQELRELGQSLESAAAQQARHEAERARLLASLEQALDSRREASSAKDEFLAVLGHELRNPLSPIVAALDLMDMRDEPAGRCERDIMRRQVRHLKRLVDDLLDVSRISSGKLQLELGPVNLAEVARESAAALPGQGIEVEAPPAVWVHGDEVRAASEGPGRGSRFEVMLPLAAAPETAPEVPVPGTARRVLLVDDNEDAAAVTAALLAGWGHDLRRAVDWGAPVAAP